MCMLNVGQALKNERLAQNKTQREWIRDIHISVSRYSEIENGIIKNDIVQLLIIAGAMFRTSSVGDINTCMTPFGAPTHTAVHIIPKNAAV